MAITYSDWRSLSATGASISSLDKLNTLQFQISALDTQITNLKSQRDDYQIAFGKATSPSLQASIKAIIDDLNGQIATAEASRASLNDEYQKLVAQVAQSANLTTAAVTTSLTSQSFTAASTSATTIEAGNTSSDPVIYNIGGVREAYFGNMSLMRSGEIGLGGTTGADDKALYINNTPARVTDAMQLWTTSQASKGMIQTYIPKSNYFQDIFPGVDATTASDLSAATNITSLKKYGFQFLYNPSEISMSIAGTSAVDYMKYVTAPPKVMPDTGSGSSISFMIILNRMPDLQYLKAPGKLRGDLTIQQVYGSAAPAGATNDLQDIYNKGTMYDVEFLLKTIVGFEMNTQLRGVTADLGFLIGRLVELHIGKSMRYLVAINGISINHVLFDNRMVPLYSTLSISAGRVPDFQGYATEG
jgi:hypothetical protein